MHVMFDTNIFDHVVKGEMDIEPLLAEITVHATHVQLDELNKTPDTYVAPDGIPYREKFLVLFQQVAQLQSTESSVYDVSRFGMGKYGGSSRVQEIQQKLVQRNKDKKRLNNAKDALIADTSIANGYVLITNDGDLYDVVKEMRGNVMTLAQLLQKMTSSEAATV